jgi:parallel beta-helix repeat protein
MIKKSLRIPLFFIALVSFTGTVSALSPTVYVDTTYTEKSSDNHVFGVDAFATKQGAIDAVTEDGIIYVKKGVYNEALTITKSLSLSSLVEHTSSGAPSDAPTIDGKAATATILVQGSSTPLRVSIFNFHIIDGNHGILVVQKAKMLISNNTIEGYTKNGITFGSKIIRGEGDVSGTINNNVVKGKGPISTISQNGIQVAEHNTATIINNTVLNNVYTNPGIKWATGILIHNTKGVTASGNTLINNQAGINILQANGNILEGNNFIGNESTNAGIMITDFDDDTHTANNNTVNKNIITGGYTGIWASYAPKNRYTNNTISNTSQYGIYFWDTDSNTVSNNTISLIKTPTHGGYGIALNGGDTKKRTIGSSFNYISENIVTDSDSGFYTSNESNKNVLIRNRF